MSWKVGEEPASVVSLLDRVVKTVIGTAVVDTWVNII